MKKSIFTYLILFLIISCAKDEAQPEIINDKEYDKSEILTKEFSKANMLIYWADYVIIPGYEDLAKTSLVLKEAIEDFTTSPSVINLKVARESWVKAYLVWQKVSITQVGKARELNLNKKLNAYPTSIGKLKEFIKKGSYDLSSRGMLFSQGFPALDYLLNAPDEIVSDNEIIEFYKENPKYKLYIKDVTNEIYDAVISVRDNFKDVYRAKFIKKFKNNHISSVKQITEYFIHEFIDNQLTWCKIDRPSGNNGSKQSIETLEARYKKDISKKLYFEALNAAINFYNGKSYDGKVTGHGLKQYLDFLDRKDLNKHITDKFADLLKVGEEDLKDNFFNQLNTLYGKGEFLTSSNELYKLSKLFRIDLLNAIGIGDNDGGTDNDGD